MSLAGRWSYRTHARCRDPQIALWVPRPAATRLLLYLGSAHVHKLLIYPCRRLPLPAAASLLKLCAGNGFTCWVGGPSPADLCPLMSASGSIEKQGCDQNVRFVCRTKGEWAACQPRHTRLPWSLTGVLRMGPACVPGRGLAAVAVRELH